MRRQRKLHQQPVDILPGVVFIHQGEQFFLRRLLGQTPHLGFHAKCDARFLLIVDIYMRGGIVSHQNHSQARSIAMLPLKCRNLLFELPADLLRQCFSAYDNCHLIFLPPNKYFSPA